MMYNGQYEKDNFKQYSYLHIGLTLQVVLHSSRQNHWLKTNKQTNNQSINQLPHNKVISELSPSYIINDCFMEKDQQEWKKHQ